MLELNPLLNGWSAPPVLPTSRPPHVGIRLCDCGCCQHRAFSLLLKLAHEKYPEIEITVHLTLIISLEMKINTELVTCSENSEHTLK